MLSYVLKSIAWFHVLDLFPCRRESCASTWSYVIRSLFICQFWEFNRLKLKIIGRLAVVLIRPLCILKSTIVLTLTWESIMLRYNIAISIAEGRTSSLISSSDPVVVSKILHCLDVLFSLFLLLISLLLLFLSNLSSQVSFVLIFLLLFLDQFSCLAFAFWSYGYHFLSGVILTIKNSEPIAMLRKTLWLLWLVYIIDEVGPAMLISLLQSKLIWGLISRSAHYLRHTLWLSEITIPPSSFECSTPGPRPTSLLDVQNWSLCFT